MFDEFDNIEVEESGFTIDNDEKAEWALRKIKEAQVEHDRLMTLAQIEIERLNKQIERIKENYERDTGWYRVQLQNYFETVEHKKTKTQEKYQLLSGSLICKRGSTKYIRDDAAMVQWLADNAHPEFIKETVTRKADWENLKKLTEVIEGNVVLTETGEVIEGVTTEVAPDEFIVNV